MSDAAASTAPGGTRRVRLVVAYDGAAFRGFARNPGVVTVAGALEDHLSRVLGHPVAVTGAGRTDAGVHAWGQVVTFDTTAPNLDPPKLMRSMNSVGAPHLAVRDVAVVPSDFDARFSARWREYRYAILTTDAPNPFLASTTWHLPVPLDAEAMNLAGRHLVGRHDFSSFCRRPRPRPGEQAPSLGRTVLSLDWLATDAEGVVRCDIRAVAFCHQMVRSIVGTLVEVGRGRRAPEELAEIIAAADRSRAGGLAPPHGLCLWRVGYE